MRGRLQRSMERKFPNAWARTLAEAGIDNRMIIPASAKLRMAMMDGQREIWKIRNDLKFNKPIQPAEERRIEKAFRVLTRLKAELLWKYTGINQDEDSNTTGEMAKKTIRASG